MSLRDLVIFRVSDSRVETFAGRQLVASSGWRTLAERAMMVEARLPASQSVASVPSGRYHVGDCLRPEDEP